MLFDLRYYSIHDGPGIRTTIFFKGCPLNCAWCHNPESQSFKPELILHPNRCFGCGFCAETCPHGAIQKIDGQWVTDRAICRNCGQCTVACYADGRQIIGQAFNTEEVMAKIDQDASFYKNSEGGVTFSGGEPMAHEPFLLELLKACRQKGYHTAIDTCGYAPWSSFEKVLPYTDLFLFDLKFMDDVKHRRFTGVSNELILANLSKLANSKCELWIRIPVIPLVNDHLDNLIAMAEFIHSLAKPVTVSLLPYHNVAETKYANLGRTYSLPDVETPSQERMQEIIDLFSNAGISVQQGGE